ncbi:Retrotransposon gag protein [Gossypium australe]|uniref:Retrotransposon gag protein n=1 Tax=Gossypium australe TaxID=47621 RepID=A0A5B6UXP9_9ROSI|nr:Retrotransposon gag protein [Gossypium australe]
MFYNGLNEHTRMVVDASANGTLFDKSYNEAYEILERIANNDYQYPNTIVGTGIRVSGAMELDAITSLTSQVSSLMNMIKIQKRPAAVQEIKATELACVYCGEDHSHFIIWEIFFRNNNNPYSNTYNPGWKQHPKFSWSNLGVGNSSNAICPNVASAPPEYNQLMPRQNV